MSQTLLLTITTAHNFSRNKVSIPKSSAITTEIRDRKEYPTHIFHDVDSLDFQVIYKIQNDSPKLCVAQIRICTVYLLH